MKRESANRSNSASKLNLQHGFTEADWNVIASPTRFPYFYGKKCAEQRAYEMAKEAGGRWSLVSINPGAIWGPPLSNRLDGESINQCLDLMSGVMWPWCASIACGFVDVRDVARAHIAAMENPQASGRYLVNACSTHLLVDAMRLLRKLYPKQWVPLAAGPRLGVFAFAPLLGLPRDLAAVMMDRVPIIDASKAARDLGMTPESYIAQETTVREMADTLVRFGMVPRFKMPVVPAVIALGLLALTLGGGGAWLLMSLIGVPLKF